MLKFSLKITVFRLQLAQFGQGDDRLVEIFHQVLALTPEVECFRMSWIHVHDLLCDTNDGLVVFCFEFADAKVGEAGKFELVQLVCALLEFFGVLVFSQEVVSNVAEVKFAIDLLVDFCRFFLIATLEKFPSDPFKPLENFQLVGHRVLVEVGSVIDAEKSRCELDCVTILERLVLVEEVACEISMQLFSDFGGDHSHDGVLLHGLEELLQ